MVLIRDGELFTCVFPVRSPQQHDKWVEYLQCIRLNVCNVQMNGKLLSTARTDLYLSASLFIQFHPFYASTSSLSPSLSPFLFISFFSLNLLILSLFSSLFQRTHPVSTWRCCPLVAAKLRFSSEMADWVQNLLRFESFVFRRRWFF